MTVPITRNHPFDSFEVTAPGRVNLIGEHTDYNDGFVLPMAIDRAIRVRVTRRPDRTAVITSERAGIVARAEFDLAAPLTPAGRGWAEYPAGVIAGYQALGFAIPGFDAAITTDLPAGGGLSSSAALEMAVATVVETLCGRSLQSSDKALLCQQAEHAFAGVPCGIMDQFAVAHGRAGHAMLLDCRSREVRHVPLPEPLAVIVIDSGVKHSLADGEYAVRRRECASAAAGLGGQAHAGEPRVRKRNGASHQIWVISKLPRFGGWHRFLHPNPELRPLGQVAQNPGVGVVWVRQWEECERRLHAR